MRVLKGAESEVLDLAFSPDGQAIAAGFGRHHGVYLWNLEAANPTPVRLVTENWYKEGGLHFSADGRSLSWTKAGELRTYNRDTREYTDHRFTLRGLTYKTIISADGSRVVSQHGLPDHCLLGWRWGDGEWIRTWTVSTADIAVSSPTLSADGSLLALLARDALGERWAANSLRVEVRDAATGQVRHTGLYLHSLAGRLLFAPDGNQLVGFNKMSLMVWLAPEPVAESVRAQLPLIEPAPERVPTQLPHIIQNDNRKHFTSIAYHPSGRQLFATSNDTTVHVFDTTTWERSGRFTWELGRLKAVAVSPDGTLAAAGGDRGDIVIWDLDV